MPVTPSVMENDDEVRRDSSKTRSGRARANPRAPRSHARTKEIAELARVRTAVAAIPVGAQAAIFRRNRRQRARDNAKECTDAVLDAPVLRASRFSDFPLSTRTRDALAANAFDVLTPVQRSAVPQALAGRDVLAAAPTGSGKTLAFVVPLIELLWRQSWGTDDALGAIILAPTRELALQIFEVFRKIAYFHGISAGLVIGGKDFAGERERVGSMNVLIATPGRLLHHLDTVADIDCNGLQMLVLDEADRILDMGFEKTLDAILEHFPRERQTLLFSATQTKSLKALARLSLRSPQYISVMARTQQEREEMEEMEEMEGQENAAMDEKSGNDASLVVGTPLRLSQSYTVIPSYEKLAVLWSFLKTHLKGKIIVFFATGKQVRFAFETFCKLRPGMSLLHLHGKMKQLRRTDVYDAFTRTKNAALFATDVASRGLDFPNVDWVVQVDCPDDVQTYIHRVGRTARFKSNGRAMLFLGEKKEMVFLERLRARGIIPNKVRINPARMAGVTPRIAATVAGNKELKSLAQRAFLFYLKSVCQQSDKRVFDATEHDIELLSKSFGLAVTPIVSFRGDAGSIEPAAKHKTKTVFGYRPRPEREAEQKTDANTVGKKRRNEEVVAPNQDEGDDEDGDILEIKRVHVPDNAGGLPELSSETTQRKRKRMKLDFVNHMPSVNRTVFDEEGNARRASEMIYDDMKDDADGDTDEYDEANKHENMEEYASAVAKRLETVAEADKLREKERVRAKHAKQKEKLRKLNRVIKPNADLQKQMLEATGTDSSGSSESESESEDESRDSDESSDDDGATGHEQLALKILAARRA